MTINEYKTLHLEHRSYFTIRDSDNDTFITADKNGNVTIFDAQANTLKQLNLNTEINTIDFSHKYQYIFYADGLTLNILNYQNEKIKSFKGEYDALFCKDDYLWAIKVVDEDTMAVELYSIERLELMEHLEIEDLFGSSSCIVFEGFGKHSIIVWMGGGQDGQANHLIDWSNGKLNMQLFEEYDCHPIEMNPSKNCFVLGQESSFSIYTYPDFKQIDHYDFPEGLYLLEHIFYLDDKRILLKAEPQMSVYHTQYKTMYDLIVREHEFKETEFYYPNLVGDTALVSDIESVYKRGNYLLLKCTDRKKEKKEHSILIIDLKKLNFEDENQLELEL